MKKRTTTGWAYAAGLLGLIVGIWVHTGPYYAWAYLGLLLSAVGILKAKHRPLWILGMLLNLHTTFFYSLSLMDSEHKDVEPSPPPYSSPAAGSESGEA